ncbi:hypothetical protein F3Y22_tig00110505pilonHSYRG00138 [Hibiscus syriacus]|uniref:RING-type E3 ubiquitin transferase n=1 Tax=Hibiscus syriacus TaxID=106335 RepID=A0A6A3ACF3_HIBSY|nr:hypothetical protein F3Y22_tig00110505pilonHSYRG00138 [Hibiscus syriacus]
MAVFLKRINMRDEHDERSAYCYIPPHNAYVFNVDLEVHRLSRSRNRGITTVEYLYDHLTCYREVLVSEEHGPDLLLPLIADKGVPLRSLRCVVVPDILSFARKVNCEPANSARPFITLSLQLVVEVNTGEDDGAAEMIAESLNTLRFNPASAPSIRGLKRFKWGNDDEDNNEDKDDVPLKERGLLEDLSSNKIKECRICLAEFSDGDETAVMPCKHVYHDVCIGEWLKINNMRPRSVDLRCQVDLLL